MAVHFPVSVKIVIPRNEKVILLRNERDEWELPGGKLDAGEDPIECVLREAQEELSLAVRVRGILDSWLYNVNGVDVVIITYLANDVGDADTIISHEHKEIAYFALGEIASLKMPDGYKRSIYISINLSNRGST